MDTKNNSGSSSYRFGVNKFQWLEIVHNKCSCIFTCFVVERPSSSVAVEKDAVATLDKNTTAINTQRINYNPII